MQPLLMEHDATPNKQARDNVAGAAAAVHSHTHSPAGRPPPPPHHSLTQAGQHSRSMPSDDDVCSDSANRRCCKCAGRAGSERALWRVVLAEGAGAALLLLLTCLPGCGPAGARDPLYRAVASGLVVALLVQCLDHVSGAQLNPTVTLAALVWGRLSARRALAMMCAQLAGATAGAALLHALRPHPVPDLCVTLPAEDLALYKAVALEAVLGGCLALANCASWDARNQGLRDSWPLRIGLAVAGLSLVGGELTGASMNPVRSFGPALWSGNWTNHWVYWVGPLSGSVLFTGTYMGAWRPRAPLCDVTPRRGSLDVIHAPPLPSKTRADP